VLIAIAAVNSPRAVYLVNSYNRFEACRFGFAGEMVEPYASNKKRIGDDILETIAALAPHAAGLDAGRGARRGCRGVRNGESEAA
jgi:carboxylate-amine ligase